MRVRLALLFFTFSIACFSQNRITDKVSCDFNDLFLQSILDSLANQVDYSFSYNTQILENTGKFTISALNQPIDQFLSKLFVGTGIEYSFFKDQIILNYKKSELVSKKVNLFTISGTIKDEEGEPLPSANVFLDGTTIGTATDIDGNYKLESIPAGYYNLVFSYIGFENAVHSISEYNGGARIQNYSMELDLNQLQEVQIESKRITPNQSQWQLNFLIFREELLGSSINAEQCIIENPTVIDYFHDKEKEVLRAYSSDPIQIRNEALGYKITYFLESFEKADNNLRYRGQIRFLNADPLRKSQRRNWNRNRKSSFNGSYNHFRRALLSNQLKKEGFNIYSVKNLSELKESKKWTRISASEIIVFKGDHYELELENYLVIEYKREKEVMDFLFDTEYSSVLYKEDEILTENPGHQISIIKLLKSSVRLDLNGQIEDKFALTTYGYWSWERLADLVPINYDPKLDKL